MIRVPATALLTLRALLLVAAFGAAAGLSACSGPTSATLKVEVSGLQGGDTATVWVWVNGFLSGANDWTEHAGLGNGTHEIELPYGDTWEVQCVSVPNYVASGESSHLVVVEDGGAESVACRYERGQPSLLVYTPPETTIEAGQVAWDFLGVAVDATSPEALVRLRNVGTASLQVHAVGTSDPVFLIDAVAVTATPIEAGSSADVRIRFRPVAAVEYESTVTVAYESRTFAFKVRGWGQ